MENIIPIKGNVSYQITLDPTVWIFDDRKVDLETAFSKEKTDSSYEVDRSEVLSKNWQKEIMEGAVAPPTIKTEKRYEKEKMLTGSFGIAIRPFLEKAEPKVGATKLFIDTEDRTLDFPLVDAYDLIIAFSKKGKPLRDDGPVHVLFPDGSNADHPITNVRAFRVE